MKRAAETVRTAAAAPITVSRLFALLQNVLNDDLVLLADPGDALFGSAELRVSHATHYLSPAYYASLGFAVPAALGVQLAKPE